MKQRHLVAQALSFGIFFSSLPGYAKETAPFEIRPQKITLSEGHGNSFPLAFSPGGRLIAVSDNNNYVTLWSPNGHFIREFSISTDTITGITFDNAGKLVLTFLNSGIKKIDLKSGSVLRTFSSPATFPITAMQISPDGKKVLVGRLNGDIELWDYKTSRLIVRNAAHNGFVSFVGFKKNGEFITMAISSFGESVIKRWDSDAKELAHYSSEYLTLALSPDGRFAAAVPRFSNDIQLLDSNFNVIRSANIKFNRERMSDPPILKFSPDGKTLALITPMDSFHPDKTMQAFFFNAKDLSNIRIADLPLPLLSGKTAGVSFSPDSKHLAVTLVIKTFEKNTEVSPGHTSSSSMGAYGIVVLDVLPGNIERIIQQANDQPVMADLSPDGKQIISEHVYPSLKLWGISGEIIRELGYDVGKKGCVGFSRDGSRIISDTPVTIRDSTGKTLKIFEGAAGPVALSWDNKLIAFVTVSVSGNPPVQNQKLVVKIQDIDNGNVVGEMPVKQRHALTILFDATGRFLISSSGIWDIYRKRWFVQYQNSKYLTYSPGRNMLATITDDTVKIISFNGKLQSQFKIKGLPDQPIVKLSDAGNLLAVTLDSGKIQMWDPITSKIKKTLSGHAGHVNSLSFSRDGRFLASTGDDGAIRLWNLANDQSIAMISSGADWLVYTPDGYFDASPHGGELAAMVKGLEAYGIEQFAARNNRPDLILERMGIGSSEQISHYYSQYQKRLKKLGLTEADLSGELHVPEAKINSMVRDGKFLALSFTVADSKFPLKSYNIFVNNVPVIPAYGNIISGNVFNGSEKIELAPGKNKIEVSALNSAGAESYRASTYADYDGKEKGDLYYLGLGISKYKNPELHLAYADKDAKDLENSILKMGQNYNAVHTKTFINADVTVENIKKAKEFLKNAKVDDTVILFAAGHGGYDKGKDPKYYYLLYDADPENFPATSVDFETIEDLLNDIKPRKKLFLLDTCESGELDEETYGQYYAIADARGFKPRTSRKPLKTRGEAGFPGRSYLYEKDRFIYNNLARRSGAIVFSSSRGGEVSYESPSIENGYFTEEILNALTDKTADTNGDKSISSDELKEFVAAAVARETGELQHPTVDRDNIYQKIELPSLAY
ncbi:MAG: hypothetical protein A2021_03725 [Elusimicrobia bacterium GWF2_52_66]|nr:MAG: hypothetical protein A2X33_10010 [Elusimicrobia bacterium GWA2_51_34]OGR84697.1 MAG: hypothetical protein A2021_03725 [Elusimicrobia bacterium GWF2_52_66]